MKIESKKCKDRNLIKGIFEPIPEKWGLRGDPYLWKVLKCEFEVVDALKDIDELETRLVKLFRKKTGKSIFDKDVAYIEEYSQGGMSSGQVDIDIWRNTFIPLLITRYNTLKNKVTDGGS